MFLKILNGSNAAVQMLPQQCIADTEGQTEHSSKSKGELRVG